MNHLKSDLLVPLVLFGLNVVLFRLLRLLLCYLRSPESLNSYQLKFADQFLPTSIGNECLLAHSNLSWGWQSGTQSSGLGVIKGNAGNCAFCGLLPLASRLGSQSCCWSSCFWREAGSPDCEWARQNSLFAGFIQGIGRFFIWRFCFCLFVFRFVFKDGMTDPLEFHCDFY
jgi:hypothetical protein